MQTPVYAPFCMSLGIASIVPYWHPTHHLRDHVTVAGLQCPSVQKLVSEETRKKIQSVPALCDHASPRRLTEWSRSLFKEE